MCWDVLTRPLKALNKHSTFVGKLWLMAHMVYRILLTIVGIQGPYNDKRYKFVCNSSQPSCDNACYNAFMPISPVLFLLLQIVLMVTPSLLYLRYAFFKIKREATTSGPEVHHDSWQQIQKDGLMIAYSIQLLCRFFLEIGFLTAQLMLYSFRVPARYVCLIESCPHVVDCSVSRSTEKTIFLFVMLVVTIVCLLISFSESVCVLPGTIFNHLARKRGTSQQSPGVLHNQSQTENMEQGHPKV